MACLTNSQVTSLLLVWKSHIGEDRRGIAEMRAPTSVKMPHMRQCREEYDANLKYHERGSKYCANLQKRGNDIWYRKKCSWRRRHLGSPFKKKLYYIKKHDCDILQETEIGYAGVAITKI